MSGEEDDGDKPYEPSQKKLDAARAKGDVPRSADITTAAAYGGFLLAALAFGPASLIGLGTSLEVFLDQADTLSAAVFNGAGAPFAGGAMTAIGADLAAWFAIPALCFPIPEVNRLMHAFMTGAKETNPKEIGRASCRERV